jgi:O-acetylhomoserine/O-acetylserine sulfhydrylase-like pyridoxal-dependent enzyme
VFPCAANIRERHIIILSYNILRDCESRRKPASFFVSKENSNQNPLNFDTLKVRAGCNPEEHNYAVSVPIYESAAFDLGSTERAYGLFSFSEFGHIYTTPRLYGGTVDSFKKIYPKFNVGIDVVLKDIAALAASHAVIKRSNRK